MENKYSIIFLVISFIFLFCGIFIVDEEIGGVWYIMLSLIPFSMSLAFAIFSGLTFEDKLSVDKDKEAGK